MATKDDELKAQEPAEVKAEVKTQPPAKAKAPAAPKPRFDWEPTSSDGKAAEHGHWRVRVQQLGATGLWRPFVEYVGDDYKTAEAAERALERLLR